MGGYSANTQSQASMTGGGQGGGGGLGRREPKTKTSRSGEYDSRFDTRYQYASDTMSVSSGSVRTQDHMSGANMNNVSGGGGGGGGGMMNQYHDNSSLFQGDPYATTGAGMDTSFNQHNHNPHTGSGGGGGGLGYSSAIGSERRQGLGQGLDQAVTARSGYLREVGQGQRLGQERRDDSQSDDNMSFNSQVTPNTPSV